MNIYKYNRQKNLTVFSCWVIISLVLTVAYIVEIIKGNRTFEYFTLFSMFTWLPLVVSYGTSLIIGRGELKIKYMISISYLIFYAFVQITSASILTFVYIMPMICVLVVYDDIKLMDLTCITAIVINIFYVIREVHKVEEISSDMLTFYEIQFACLVLCTIFLHGATRVVTYGNEKLEKLNNEVSIDELTSAYNRYYLTRLLKDLNFKETDVTLAIIDIDSFKEINDTYGHKFGDLVLRKISSIIRDYTDTYNNTYFIRIGGDEFIILSTFLGKNELYNLASDACERISSTKLMYGDTEVGFSVSIGIASSKEDNCTSYSRIYEFADSLLYTVKHKGKSAVAKR